MNKYVEIIVGLVVLVAGVSLGVLNIFGFGNAMLGLLKGSLGWMVILIGSVLIGMGIGDLRN